MGSLGSAGSVLRGRELWRPKDREGLRGTGRRFRLALSHVRFSFRAVLCLPSSASLVPAELLGTLVPRARATARALLEVALASELPRPRCASARTVGRAQDAPLLRLPAPPAPGCCPGSLPWVWFLALPPLLDREPHTGPGAEGVPPQDMAAWDPEPGLRPQGASPRRRRRRADAQQQKPRAQRGFLQVWHAKSQRARLARRLGLEPAGSSDQPTADQSCLFGPRLRPKSGETRTPTLCCHRFQVLVAMSSCTGSLLCKVPGQGGRWVRNPSPVLALSPSCAPRCRAAPAQGKGHHCRCTQR